MVELTTLARPYARAAFEYALQRDALTLWAEGLATAAAVSAEERVAALLSAPSLSTADKARAIIEVCGEACDAGMQNFIRILADNRRLPLLQQIHELFLLLKANQEQSVKLEVSSAFEVDSGQAERLAEIMGRKLKRRIELTTLLDRNLLGGVVIRAGDMVIDGSLRGRLAKLSEAMNS